MGSQALWRSAAIHEYHARTVDHNSDTFDRILDLSLDIFKCESLKEALRKFVAVDYLKGADKYKCEKYVHSTGPWSRDFNADVRCSRCKKHVNAEKRFTIHEAPPVPYDSLEAILASREENLDSQCSMTKNYFCSRS